MLQEFEGNHHSQTNFSTYRHSEKWEKHILLLRQQHNTSKLLLTDNVITGTYCCSPPMPIQSPVTLMTTCATTPYRLQPRSSQINLVMLP